MIFCSTYIYCNGHGWHTQYTNKIENIKFRNNHHMCTYPIPISYTLLCFAPLCSLDDNQNSIVHLNSYCVIEFYIIFPFFSIPCPHSSFDYVFIFFPRIILPYFFLQFHSFGENAYENITHRLRIVVYIFINSILINMKICLWGPFLVYWVFPKYIHTYFFCWYVILPMDNILIFFC